MTSNGSILPHSRRPQCSVRCRAQCISGILVWHRSCSGFLTWLTVTLPFSLNQGKNGIMPLGSHHGETPVAGNCRQHSTQCTAGCSTCCYPSIPRCRHTILKQVSSVDDDDYCTAS
ncbi:hypothetical protein BJX76DRAFT_64499 [Aspergillus varians]